jgi:hypothetical protein
MTHWNIENWKAMSTVLCQYDIQINESHYLDHFPICQEANGVSQRKYICRQHETLDGRKLHKQLSNSYHKDMCDKWMVFGQGCIYFLIDRCIWGWVKNFWTF